MVTLSRVKMGTFSGLNLRVPLKWGSFWGSKWWPFLGSKWWPFLGSKWGNSWLPQSPTYSHYYHFTFGIFLYSLTFYSLTSIFTSETSERERKLASKSLPVSYDVVFVLHKIAFPSYALSSHVFEKNLFV